MTELKIPRLALLALAAALSAALSTTASAAPAKPKPSVISNRADLISGGDALVSVAVRKGARARVVLRRRVRGELRSRDLSRRFARRPNGRYQGIVRGLRKGRNVIVARGPGGRAARIAITNHPNSGPVFAGPQPKPWKCQETARDRDCNEPTRYSYRYLPAGSPDLQPYDPQDPPADVATTTTDEGVEVPFIVRSERGYQDRNRYRIDVLFQPGERWKPWAAQEQWNHKLLVMHGGSCNVSYEVSDPPFADYAGTLPAPPPGIPDSSTVALGRGFAVMSTALDNSGVNCNPALQAESLMMAKEHLIESYGTLRYTIGTGCSGGSLAEQWVANAYPGIYQGLIAQCSFPDAGSTAQQIVDYVLLAKYFGSDPTASDEVPWQAIVQGLAGNAEWTGFQEGEVSSSGAFGVPNPTNSILSAWGYWPAAPPTGPCDGIEDDDAYDPASRPDGVRCGIVEWNRSLLGPRRRRAWGPQERAIGRGFTGVPVDNVGVQYGLASLERGAISPEQFVDLNAEIGGFNIDFEPVPERLSGNRRALRRAYRTGLINQANNLDRVPIINLNGPNDPGLAHDSFRAFAMWGRLDREHGTHANQVIWQGPTPIAGDAYYTAQALIAIDRWLGAIAADRSRRPLAAKVIANKPADAHERCSNGLGLKLHDGLCSEAIVPVYGTPRTVAGEPLTTDQNKCRLRPLRREDYPVAFTDAQWARLAATFPTGVCDYSRPGVGQRSTVAWLTYFNKRGTVRYGGRRLGRAPRRSGAGWTAPAFRSWLKGR